MSVTDRYFYIIKQDNGMRYNFTYDENIGIIFRTRKNNEDSFYDVLVEECKKNFSVLLFENDNICFVYQDLNGNIKMRSFKEEKWSEDITLVKNSSELYEVNFKAILNNNQIYLFFSVLNKETNTTALFHQVVDSELNLLKPNFIDRTNFYYENPFTIYALNNDIFIMYQRFNKEHEIGYKVFNYDQLKWSDFCTVDSSNEPYIDYSLLFNNEILHAVYIKNNDNENTIIYWCFDKNNFHSKELYKGNSIISCSSFIDEEDIWISWITDNSIYTCLSSEKGENISSPYYHELLISSNILKAIYTSNEQKDLKMDEIYIKDEKNIDNKIFPDVYPIIRNINKNESLKEYLSGIKGCMNNKQKSIRQYKKIIEDKEDLICEMCKKAEEVKQQLQLEKSKCRNYEIKLVKINKQNMKFENSKRLLRENINHMQQSLLRTEEKFTELENINLQKQNEIIYLNEQIDEKENIIKMREKEIKDLKVNISEEKNKNLESIKQIEILKEQIENLKIKSSDSSLFQRIFKK